MMNCKIQLVDYQITHAHIHTHIHREIVSSIINRGEYRRLGGYENFIDNRLIEAEFHSARFVSN